MATAPCSDGLTSRPAGFFFAMPASSGRRKSAKSIAELVNDLLDPRRAAQSVFTRELACDGEAIHDL
jgi:hypothetical protein